MKYCGQCGQQLKDEARFCNKCGAAMPEQEAATAAREKEILPGTPASEKPKAVSPEAGPKTPLQPDIPPISAKPQGRGFPVKTKTIITGIVIALLLVAGGFWGWRSLGSEARVQKKLDLAVKYLSENKFEEAILAYNDAIKIEPKEAKAYQGLARVYTLQGKYDDAKDTYDKGLAAVEQDKKQTLQMGLAGMYMDQGQLASAEKAFQEIKNSNKACLEAYWGLAMVYQKQGDNTKAEAMLKQAVDQNPNEYRAYNTLALFLKQNNKGDEAFNNLVKSLALEINQQEAYLVLSDLYKGRWPQLQSKLAAVSNQSVSAMLEFYSCYAAGDYQKALTIYNNKLSGQASNQKARVLSAIAMVKTGDKTGAESIVSQLSKEKLNEWLLSDLSYYYQAAGDKEKAKDYAVKALQANGFNLDAIALLQKLNTGDEKIYAAEFLLYNWKPVGEVKDELKDVYPLNLTPAIISDKAQEVELTPDYFIPDISRQYVFHGATDQCEIKSMVTWSKDNQGKFIKSEEFTLNVYGQVEHSLYKDTFLVQNDSIYCTNRYSHTSPFGVTQSSTIYGNWVILKTALPGETWNSTYTEVGTNYKSPFDKITKFVGFEEIIIMGKKEQAAHLNVTYKTGGTNSYKVDEDYWLVRNIGIVKIIKTASNVHNVDTEKLELTAIQ